MIAKMLKRHVVRDELDWHGRDDGADDCRIIVLDGRHFCRVLILIVD